MNKAVMISIQPKWCELIASGKKTIEVRKTKPKIDTPFKCYIYCTNQKIMGELLLRNGKLIGQNRGFRETGDIPVAGKVIGEFVCNFIKEFACDSKAHRALSECGSCLSEEEIRNYCNGKTLYGWDISDLKIYDKPKELSEFGIMKKCNACKSGYESNACIYDNNCKVPMPITKPFQSWGYICSNE